MNKLNSYLILYKKWNTSTKEQIATEFKLTSDDFFSLRSTLVSLLRVLVQTALSQILYRISWSHIDVSMQKRSFTLYERKTNRNKKLWNVD